MKVPVTTITKRLFFSFGILVFNIVVIVFLSLFFLWRTRTITRISQRIDNQRILIVRLIKTDLDFLRFETVNHQFYETGKSALLDVRDSLFRVIENENTLLHREMVSNNFLIDYQFHLIDSMLLKYNGTFVLLTQKINTRGFKDYGLEGTMRNYAHEMESMRTSIPLTGVLMLRRHEKDFLLRKEALYINQFNELAGNLIESLILRGDTLSANLLVRYQKAFNRLTQLNYEIGITPTEGLLGQLSHQTQQVSARLEELTALSTVRTEEVIQQSGVIFSITSFVTIILSLALTYYTSTRLARPIKKLSISMGRFMVNEGLNEQDLQGSEETNEISNLSQSFIRLSRKLKMQFSEIEEQNQELKKLNEELDRFIYSAAHDLKSPLASLDGLVRLAEREINSPAHAHYFRMMGSSLRKLEGFIRDITDYARNKRQELKVEKVDMEAMIREVVDSLKFLPQAHRIQVQVNIQGSEFYTDKTRLEIILKNLISNSFRYMDSKKNHSYIRIEGRVDEEHARISIVDNGIGIGQEHLPRIYDMFYRAVDHSHGTGIGLFLVKESVKMLRGRIAVKSSLGEWTMFYLSLTNFKKGVVNLPETEAIVPSEALEQYYTTPSSGAQVTKSQNVS